MGVNLLQLFLPKLGQHSSAVFLLSRSSKLFFNSSRICAAIHTSTTTVFSSESPKFQEKVKNGPDLQHFIAQSQLQSTPKLDPYIMKRNPDLEKEPYIDQKSLHGQNAKVFIRTYGCQMNVNDTEIASSILSESGYQMTDSIDKAEIVFLMTCAIRENAENKVWHKLRELEQSKKLGMVKKFGLLGCMAERLKMKVLEELPSIDIIAGPDSYRHLPKLLAVNGLTGQNAVNVLLSLDETYSDVIPQNSLKNSAFVSITRGCNNMCSYCIVPFTRGRERSRTMDSILKEVQHFADRGVKEIILLGQNVNSYRDFSADTKQQASVAQGFKTIYKLKSGGIGFDTLLDEVAQVNPEVRIRFTSPHPKDFTDSVLEVIDKHRNIANGLHLPVQSGSDRVLESMRRGYTRQAYIELVERLRHIIPGCGLSSDFICGFCGETDDDHRKTVDLIEKVGYQIAYIFAYSMREKTHAYHRLNDDVPQETKISRLIEVNEIYRKTSLKLNQKVIGEKQLILVEGDSKRSADYLYGRNEANQKVIIPKQKKNINNDRPGESNILQFNCGDFVEAKITDCTSMTLIGDPIRKTTISQFYNTN